MRKLRNNQGFSLPEVLVVVTIMMALAGATTWIFIGILTAATDAGQRLHQFVTIEQTTSFMNARLSSTSPGMVGYEQGSEMVITPASVAGDQLFFQRGSTCYRVFHIERLQEFWVTSASTCGELASPSGVVRGPNQEIAPGSFSVDPGDPRYDPVLDGVIERTSVPGVSTFLLAEGIVRQGNKPIFELSDSRRNPEGIDANGNSESSTVWYQNRTRASLQHVNDVMMNLRVLGNPARGPNNQIIGNRDYSQRFYLGQVCPPI